MKLIIIFVILFFINNFVKSNNINQQIKLLKNGGISLNKENRICAYSYSGENCEIIDTNEKCSQAKDIGDSLILDTSTICCWSKYRTDSNLTELKISMGPDELYTNDDYKIKGIFKTYGPWYERDILLSNYLIENTNNELKMKYSNKIYNEIVQVDQQPQETSHCNDPSLNPIAFSLMIHKIDFDKIKSLFELIYKPYNYYVIHIDKKLTNFEKIEELKLYFNQLEMNEKENHGTKWYNYPSNIKIMNDRFYGIWGGISLIYMELASYTQLFDMMIERKGITNNKLEYQWSHVINLSANDMPCKSITELSKILCKNKNTIYLEEAEIKPEYRFSETFMEENGYLFTLTNENFTKFECGNHGMMKYYNRSNGDGVYSIMDGTQWHCLTTNFAHYLISSTRSLERLFSFKFSYIPDETFFQSTKPFYPLINHPIIKFNNSSLTRLTMWNKDPKSTENQRYSVELEDVDKITNHTFFIRKVYKQQVRDSIIKKFNLLEK